MSILKISEPSLKTPAFSDLKPGTVFKFIGHFYMKIVKIEHINAICLNTHEAACFDARDTCLIVESATLEIKP